GSSDHGIGVNIDGFLRTFFTWNAVGHQEGDEYTYGGILAKQFDAPEVFPEVIPPPPHPGDFDLDGDVDGADFVIWQTHFPESEDGGWIEGDGDGDGDVDGADFVIWQTNFPYFP